MSQSQSQGTSLKRKASVMVKRPKVTGLTVDQQKAVRSIAKSVTLNLAETKSFISNVVQPLFNDLVYAQNLIFGITQGNAAEGIVGEKMYLKNFYMRFLLTSTNNGTATNESLGVRLLVIRTKKPLVNTWGPIVQGDVFRGANVAFAYQGMVDMHEVDLLYDQVHEFEQPNQLNINSGKFVEIKVPVNKTHYFDTDNGGYFKDKNYYLIATAVKDNIGIATNVGAIRGQWLVNFKDS